MTSTMITMTTMIPMMPRPVPSARTGITSCLQDRCQPQDCDGQSHNCPDCSTPKLAVLPTRLAVAAPAEPRHVDLAAALSLLPLVRVDAPLKCDLQLC
jgi:hypothetical protein